MDVFELQIDFLVVFFSSYIPAYLFCAFLSLIPYYFSPKIYVFSQKYPLFLTSLLAFIYVNYLYYEKFFFDLIYINLLFSLLFLLRIISIIRTALNERNRNNISDAQTFIN